MVVIAITLASVILGTLLTKLTSSTFIHFVQGNESVYDHLNKLKVLLLSVNATLNIAEEKQLGDTAVREWLSELEDVIFDADYMVDKINTQALREAKETADQVKVKDLLKGTARKIKKMTERLEFIVRQKDLLGLKERSLRAPRPAPFEDESSIYGRDEDKKKILDMLLQSDDSPVISIVGMAGIGKTTLAQLVYNDDRVKTAFQCRAWITVSTEFDVFVLTKAVLEAVTFQTTNTRELFPLQAKLDLALSGKKFLFVLDDVWNEDYVQWNTLTSPLRSGAPGSKIIVTTRSDRVASMMSNVSTHRLQELGNSFSRLLFVKHAFEDGDRTLSLYPDLRGVTDQVVNKCSGLPLAIKSLGGLLRFEVNVEEWEKVLTSDIWELSERERNILPALWLSYCHLPPYLRRCFAYCSIFPKGHKIKKLQLVLMWMAEDLLLPRSGRRIEDIGEEYIASLVSRSLLQSSKDEVFMHDFVHDMAAFVSRRSLQILETDHLALLDRKTRYLAFMNKSICAHKGVEGFESALKKNKVLRSFLAFGNTKQDTTRGSVNWKTVPGGQRLRAVSLSCYRMGKLPVQINNLKSLRYFDISDSEFERIPDEIGTLVNLQTLLLNSCSRLSLLPATIGKLKQLRYMDLSFTAVKEIPKGISNLSNLQTLLLSKCENLTRLPDDMSNLTGLLHLDISGTICLKQMPPQMSRLKGLVILTDYVVAKGTRSSIEELRELQGLQGSLTIWGLQHVVDEGDALNDNLRGKKNLSKLLMKWKSCGFKSDQEEEVLTKLQPHTNLKELSIENYNGGRFPNWVGQGSFSKMVVVALINCKHCSSLPPLGLLPSLEQLTIMGFHELETIGKEFYSNCVVSQPFKSLRMLYIEDMPLWHTWSFFPSNRQDEAFPRLEQLWLSKCKSLIVNLPYRLESIISGVTKRQKLMVP